MTLIMIYQRTSPVSFGILGAWILCSFCILSTSQVLMFVEVSALASVFARGLCAYKSGVLHISIACQPYSRCLSLMCCACVTHCAVLKARLSLVFIPTCLWSDSLKEEHEHCSSKCMQYVWINCWTGLRTLQLLKMPAVQKFRPFSYSLGFYIGNIGICCVHFIVVERWKVFFNFF